jgi:hypothetical protein
MRWERRGVTRWNRPSPQRAGQRKRSMEYAPIDKDNGSALNSKWLAWLVVLGFIALWALMVYRYPVYFQRDDARSLAWVQTHSFTDCFKTSSEGPRSHDGRYRPLPYLAFKVMYGVFGFGSHGWHFTLGLFYILGMVFLFKLVSCLSDRATSYIAVFLWLGAFQFLLTLLFWFSDVGFVLEMAIALPGLYLVVVGLRRSTFKLLIGAALLILSFFDKEPMLIIAPFAVATYILTQGSARLGLSRSRSILYAAIALLSSPVFLAFFPYALQTPGNTGIVQAGSTVTRLMFYSKQLSSGVTGILLLTPAFYYILRLAQGKRGPSRFAITLVVSVIAALAISKGQLYPLGPLVLFGAGLLAARQHYLFLPWAFLPFLALLKFPGMFRTYLYELSFALTALAALQARVLLQDLAEWWMQRVKLPVVTYAALSLAVIAVLSGAAVKGLSQAPLLQRRSDITMAVKDVTPRLKSLPRNSTLVVMDYNSLGRSPQSAALSEEEKLQVQGPMIPYYNARAWMRVISRSDVKVAQFREYQEDPTRLRRSSGVFLWLMTPADHEFASNMSLTAVPYASFRHGTARMDILKLR